MPAYMVYASPVPIAVTGGRRPVIQNLGPSDLSISLQPGQTLLDGIVVPVNEAYEWPGKIPGDNLWLYLVSDATGCDVRVLQIPV